LLHEYLVGESHDVVGEAVGQPAQGSRQPDDDDVDVRVGVARTVEYFRSLLGSDRMLPRAEPEPRPGFVPARGAA